MSNTRKSTTAAGSSTRPKKQRYKDILRELQMELVKLQRHFIECDDTGLAAIILVRPVMP